MMLSSPSIIGLRQRLPITLIDSHCSSYASFFAKPSHGLKLPGVSVRRVSSVQREQQAGAHQKRTIPASFHRPQYGTGHALNLNVPRLMDAMHFFGAKIGMALHHHATGAILPRDGGVAVRWYSNVDSIAGDIPSSLLELFNSPKTLRQGSFEISGQFQYDSRAMPDGSLSMHWATFRFSFAVFAAAAASTDTFTELDVAGHLTIVRPGAFRGQATPVQ
jgi:hypothetical protein